jgi:hypothetical protein
LFVIIRHMTTPITTSPIWPTVCSDNAITGKFLDAKSSSYFPQR